MPGRVANALIRREIEAYLAQGLPEEALSLLDNRLRSHELPDHLRSGLEAQVRRIKTILSDSDPDEQVAVADEQIDVIRKGWHGSDTLEDHLECAEGLQLIGRFADALTEFRAAVRKGLPLKPILPQLADCLARVYPAPVLPDETARLARDLLLRPNLIPAFEIVLAELMAQGGRIDHAAALAGRLADSGGVPERLRARLASLIKRLRAARP
jgi:hypothetical protein